MDDLLHVVPKLISRIDSLESDLNQTKLTMGNAIMKLVKKVKKMEGLLKKRHVVLSDSEEEEPEAQGRKSQDDPLDSSVQGLVTPSTTKVKASGEEQGRRYKRRKEAKGKKVVSSLVFQEEVDTGAEQVNTAKGVNTGSTKLSTVSEHLSTGSEQVSTGGAKKSTSSQDKGQREGKAPMISEETPKKSKEQILQEEASLAEAIRLDSLQKEEEAKQIHLDSLLAQRIAEEEELNEQQKKRKAQVQFEAQHYTNEDWDLIRAKIEANAELSKSMLGSELQGEDFAKKMVDLVNQRKKYFAEERARAKRNKPMTQSQLKTYMMNYLKNQGTWKLSQLKNLSFEEVKEEFDKLVKQVESFAPMNFEATKASLKRFGEELQTKTPKRMKDDEAKDDEPTKKSGKRRKQMARRGLHTNIDKDDSEGSDEVSEQDDSVTGAKGLTSPEQTATSKGISNPLMAGKSLKARFLLSRLEDLKTIILKTEVRKILLKPKRKATGSKQGYQQIKRGPRIEDICYALTKNQKVCVSFIKQFWRSAEVTIAENREVKITATIDGHSLTITEGSLQRHLKLDNQDGLSSIPNSKIFEQLALMGYHTDSDNPKKTAWEQFSSNIATALICLATNRKYNFSRMIFEHMVSNISSPHKFLMYPRPTKGFSGQEVALFPTMLDVTEPSTSPSRITSSPSPSPDTSPSHSPEPST
ncbi:hypothetical protein Tco_0217168 [Tanacetum coccineum]